MNSRDESYQSDEESLIHYLYFDEYVLERMSACGWKRSQGIIKLIPFACALYTQLTGPNGINTTEDF